MIIPHYIRCIREGFELAGFTPNFVLLSERYLYGDHPFEDGRRIFQDVYGKPIPPAFDERRFNITDRLDVEERLILKIPNEFNPIVLLTKGSTLKLTKLSYRKGLLKKYVIEFLKKLRPKEFGKILIVTAFHEASHRKYGFKTTENCDIDAIRKALQKCDLSKDAIEMLQESDLRDYISRIDGFVLNFWIRDELPVYVDELLLAKRRPDLEPFIKLRYDYNLKPYVIQTYQLAKRLVGS